MAWRHWLRGEPEPSEGGLTDYRRELLAFLAVFIFFAAWLALLDIVLQRGPTLAETATVWLGLGIAGGIFALRRSRPCLASWLVVAGGLLWIGLLIPVLQQPMLLPLIALPVLLAALLIGTPAALLAGLAASAVVIRLSALAGLAAASQYAFVLIVAALGIGIVSDRGLALVSLWEREASVHQREMILKLRDRQGELNRTLKALDEDYVSLKRSHDEQVQERQQANDARTFKEQFVANISHELRTPLNLMVGFAEIMYLSPETYEGVTWTPELENDVHEMYRASRHLQSLVDDILDLSRIDAARLPLFREILDIRTVVTEAVETVLPLARQRGLSLTVRLPPTLPQLSVDRTRIRQVLLNLLNNAVRFTDQGGITVDVTLLDSAVVVSVCDTGVGIPEGQLAHVFEEFRQIDAGPRSRGGTGLGLALSRQFVELHSGRMWAESQMGVGSTLSFSLPLPGSMGQSAPLLHIPYHRQEERSDAPVIVVDPDTSVADMLRRYLGDRRLVAARSVEEAEGMIDRQHPLGIIVNQMPDAPMEAWFGPLGQISSRYGVPVFRCAIPSPSWLQRAAGLQGCLTKPVTRETLGHTLEAISPPKRILVVDDDVGFVGLICRMLVTLGVGAEISRAYTGAQALRLAREKQPDLVLLDLLMPEIDGFEVLRQIRSDPVLASTCVIAVTATSYGEEILQRHAAYFTVTHPPGISPGKMTELLDAALGIMRPSYAESARASA